MTVSEYIIKMLKKHGTEHVFGIPGTSCSGFFDAVDKDTNFSYVVTTSELEAGYIADGYGRTGAIGTVCVSYGVGTLSLVNAIASGYTERVPMMVINGGPTKKDLELERKFGCLFSHSTGSSETDLRVFQQVTAGAFQIKSTEEAKQKIDAAFALCVSEFRPVYLELPQDFWGQEMHHESEVEAPSEVEMNVPFFEEAFRVLQSAKCPSLILGVELVRLNLKDQLIKLIEKWNVPFATTALAKSVISESHTNFVGCYDSDLFHSEKFKPIDDSDCIFALGCIWGIDHREFVERKSSQLVEVSFGTGRIFSDKHEGVAIVPALEQFLEWSSDSKPFEKSASSQLAVRENSSEEFGHDQVFSCVNNFLEKAQNVQVAIDTCLGSFPGADLKMPGTEMYLANPVWLSIGHGTPASIGSYLKNQKRPIVVTGDGGFQIVSQAFSTMVKYEIPAILIVLDNGLYAIEQYLIDNSYFVEERPPLPYVVLNSWSYENFPQVYGGGRGLRATTTDELASALNEWGRCEEKTPWIVACQIPRKDLPS